MMDANTFALLTTAQMYRADQLAMEGGISGPTLMQAAGQAVADCLQQHYPGGAVLILCGPGNNGGDGYVAARLLMDAGRRVTVAAVGETAKLQGDAADAFAKWTGETVSLSPDLLEEADVVVDALFGAGLSRSLDGDVAAFVSALNATGKPVIAVDVPSGVAGDTGAVQGVAVQAAHSVTFFRKKPGHLLMPGRLQCGQVQVAQIGIPPSVLDEIAPQTCENNPALWLHRFPWPRLQDHKYARGHAIVVAGGPHSGGAARLAARSALRAGAGLVTLTCQPDAADNNAARLEAVMLQAYDEFSDVLDDQRRNAILLGPGNGVTGTTRQNVLTALAAGRTVVLDADALTVFEGQASELASAIKGPAILTPHEGEFARLFPGLSGSKLDRARQAAEQLGAVVLLKGPDTVIAAHDGPAVINSNAPATLATAGSGDVLAGIILGLATAGMPVFEAACAGAWLHGAAATSFGPGLIAEDIAEQLPQVLAELASD